MAKQSVNLGTSANKGDGDPLRTAFDKVNDNFTEVYSLLGAEGGDVDDVVAPMLVHSDHTNVTVTRDDAANKIIFSVDPYDGDITGSVFGDDSTLLVDGVNGTIPWAVVNGTPTTLAGYGITDAQVAGAPYDGDITGSVFGDDSTLLVDGVNGNIPLSVISELNGQAVRIGSRAGDQTAANIIAIGSDAGRNAGNQGIAIGRLAGSHGTGGVNTVAIGAGAGYQNQGNQGVAIGYQAGYTDQGNYGIALGFRAGQDLQHDNTIIINADSGVSSLDSEGTSRFYVNPIRSAAMTTILGYDATTKEVTHNAAIPGYISLADLKTEVAASADFAAFKIRIAAL
mgnify:CR=1 FL=1